MKGSTENWFPRHSGALNAGLLVSALLGRVGSGEESERAGRERFGLFWLCLRQFIHRLSLSATKAEVKPLCKELGVIIKDLIGLKASWNTKERLKPHILEQEASQAGKHRCYRVVGSHLPCCQAKEFLRKGMPWAYQGIPGQWGAAPSHPWRS